MLISLCHCYPKIKHGFQYWKFATYLGDCVWTDQEVISFFLGFLSILCWVFAQLPQIFVNFWRGEAESVSIFFFIAWLVGDICNLTGCIFTHQMPSQTYLAGYWVIVDCISVIQVFVFQLKRKKQNHDRKKSNADADPNALEEDLESSAFQDSIHAVHDGTFDSIGGSFIVSEDVSDANERTPVDGGSGMSNSNGLATIDREGSGYGSNGSSKVYSRSGLVLFVMILCPVVFAFTTWIPAVISHRANTVSMDTNSFNIADNRILDDDSGHKDVCGEAHVMQWEKTLGVVLGWVSGCLYFVSRIFQVVKNFRRRSTEGLSPIMFILAVLGNLLYGVSILIREFNWTWIYAHLPWLVGSQLTMVWDFTIAGQFVLFKIRDKIMAARSLRRETHPKLLVNGKSDHVDEISVEESSERTAKWIE